MRDLHESACLCLQVCSLSPDNRMWVTGIPARPIAPVKHWPNLGPRASANDTEGSWPRERQSDKTEKDRRDGSQIVWGTPLRLSVKTTCVLAVGKFDETAQSVRGQRHNIHPLLSKTSPHAFVAVLLLLTLRLGRPCLPRGGGTRPVPGRRGVRAVAQT